MWIAMAILGLMCAICFFVQFCRCIKKKDTMGAYAYILNTLADVTLCLICIILEFKWR